MIDHPEITVQGDRPLRAFVDALQAMVVEAEEAGEAEDGARVLLGKARLMMRMGYGDAMMGIDVVKSEKPGYYSLRPQFRHETAADVWTRINNMQRLGNLAAAQ